MSSKYKVISFYTPDYVEEYEGLLVSLNQYNIPHELTKVSKKRNSWFHTTMYKLPFIAKQLRKHDCPLVWLDADARVVRPPVLFDELCERAVDIAIGVMPTTGEYMTNCIFIKPTQIVYNYLNAVYKMILTNPYMFSQLHLGEQAFIQYALQQGGWESRLHFERLPFGYCKAEQWGKEAWQRKMWSGETVILQRQASRWLDKAKKEMYDEKGLATAVKT